MSIRFLPGLVFLSHKFRKKFLRVPIQYTSQPASQSVNHSASQPVPRAEGTGSRLPINLIPPHSSFS